MRYLAAAVPAGGVLALIGSIYSRRQTGTLELATEAGNKNLYFVEGHLHICRSVSPLAQRISDQIEQSDSAESGQPSEVLTELLRMAAEHFSNWTVKSYRFIEGFRVDAGELVGPLPTAALVMAARTLEDRDSSTLVRVMGGYSATIVATVSDAKGHGDFALTDNQRRLLELLREPVTISDLLGQSGRDPDQASHDLARLWALSLIRNTRSDSPPAAASHTSRPKRTDAGESSESRRAELEPLLTKRSSSEVEERLPPRALPTRPPSADRAELRLASEDTALAEGPDRSGKGSVESEQHEIRIWRQHFGLDCAPFSLSPNPSFLFLSDDHKEALAGLRLSLVEKRGLCAMTGEVGTGKTTLLYSLLSSLGSDVEAAYIHNPALPFDQLLEVVLRDFGIAHRSNRRVDLLNVLNEFLVDCARQKKTAAMVIDEAQNLADSTFEALRLLLNFETFDSKLLQIILVGQPELGARLRSDKLRQIADRIAVRCHLHRLSQADCRKYIGHRLEAARGELEIFSRGAVKLVLRKSRGVPRRINVICHNAMLFAYAQDQRRVTRPMVAEAIRDLNV